MQKRVLGHMRTEKVQINSASVQSNQGLYCPLTESLDTTELTTERTNEYQRPGWYCAHAYM